MFSERTVTSEEIFQYAPLVDRMAWKYTGTRGAEFDDLRQEGLIAVWHDLKNSNTPSFDSIKDRLRKWVRHISREGMGGYDEHLSYDTASLVFGD